MLTLAWVNICKVASSMAPANPSASINMTSPLADRVGNDDRDLRRSLLSLCAPINGNAAFAAVLLNVPIAHRFLATVLVVARNNFDCAPVATAPSRLPAKSARKAALVEPE